MRPVNYYKNNPVNCYKNNAEEDYVNTPISVLKYITKLEDSITGSATLDAIVKYFLQMKKVESYSVKLTIDVDSTEVGYKLHIVTPSLNDIITGDNLLNTITAALLKGDEKQTVKQFIEQIYKQL